MKSNVRFSTTFILLSIFAEKYVLALDLAQTFDNLVEKVVPLFKDPEEDMTITEVIQYHGYPNETYDVTTADGYILMLHRIPYGKINNDTSKPRKPVIIQHGIISTSSIWIANTPDKNLAYLLAEKGFDVWLGNFRGNTFTRRHVSRTPNRAVFWKFSFDEMGLYDLPAMIDFILDKTGFNQLHYVAHSMGTTAMFALLSTKTEYNEKVRGFHAMAPVARLDYVKSPIVLFGVPFAEEFSHYLEAIGGDEFFPNSSMINLISDSVCKWPTRRICSNVLFEITGFDNTLFNDTRLPVYLHFFPSGTSSQNMHHFAQITAQHRFQAYDFGEDGNMEQYKQAFPPLYDVTKITAPVALYWGKTDWIATPQDMNYLIRKLNKSLVLNYPVPFKEFNHLDFMWATKAVPLVYEKVFETMEKLWPDE